jgi:TDG/mug DNA glycosylase family protein
MILPDLISHGLDIVFCGTAVGNESAKRNAYYAGRGNQFYSVLFKSNLTPYILNPEEYVKLISFKIGLTDLAKNSVGNDSAVSDEDYDVISFKSKIIKYQPKIICFNGKEAARACFNMNKTSGISYGLQSETLNKTKLYVAPSTSAAARKYWDDAYWINLKQLVQ